MRPPPAAQPEGRRPAESASTRGRCSTTKSTGVRGPVFIGSALVAQYPTGGGADWVPLRYVRGLWELGQDAGWLELLWTRRDPAMDRRCIETFLEVAREFGVSDRVALVYFPEGARDEPAGRAGLFGMSAEAYAER